MEQVNNEKVEIDLKELFVILLHRIWIIASAALVCAIVSGIINKYVIDPVYTSSTKVYVINRQDDNRMTYSDIQTGTQLTKDYMVLVKSRPVTEQVISRLGLNMTHEQLIRMIRVDTPQDTRILEIYVSHPDPVMAKQIADSIAEISKERMVSVMEIEKVNVMEPGNLPTSPSSPNVMNNTILGGIFGGIIASIIILLIHIINDSIRTSEDVEKYLSITTLGIIPLEEGAKKKKIGKRQTERKTAFAG